jgi:hypothetical protein
VSTRLDPAPPASAPTFSATNATRAIAGRSRPRCHGIRLEQNAYRLVCPVEVLLGTDEDKPIGTPIGQWLEEYRLGDAEQRRAGPDAEREREHGDRREAGRAAPEVDGHEWLLLRLPAL